MHSNPQHLSQNGAVVVWAPMHQGCALLSDGCSRSATLYTTAHEPADTDTNTERHFHANIQGLSKCAIAQMCTQRQILISQLLRITHTHTQKQPLEMNSADHLVSELFWSAQ